MPGVRGPATSLWPLGSVGDTLRFGKSRLGWVGTLLKYAIALSVGAAALASALRGHPLGWPGVAFTLFFLVAMTRDEFSYYEVRVDRAGRRLTRVVKPFLGRAGSETIDGRDVRELVFAKGDVTSVTLVMKDDRRVELDRGTAEEPLRELAEETSRALGVKLTC